jgi:hypothetical protein
MLRLKEVLDADWDDAIMMLVSPTTGVEKEKDILKFLYSSCSLSNCLRSLAHFEKLS